MSDGWTEVLIAHLRGSRAAALPRIEERCGKRLRESEPLLSLIPKVFERRLRDEVDDALVAGFQKATKERTANCLAFVFWQSLRSHLRRRREPPVNLPAIANALGVSTSNLSRWGRKTVPSANKFFLAALTWSIDVRALSPDWSASPACIFDPAGFGDVVPRGVAVTVQQIRVGELGQGHAVIGLDELDCVGTLKRDGAGFGLICARGPAAEAVAEGIIGRSPLMAVRDPARVVGIASEWLLAYTLFDEARPDWRFLRGH